MLSTITHAGLKTGLALLAIVSWTSGRITETTAANKPPFSFSCAPVALSDSMAVCGSIPEKPYVRIDKVIVHRDTSSNNYGECLDPEKGALSGELSKWYNVECKKAVLERPEETYRVPLSYLEQAIKEYCRLTPPTITKIEVEYDCARTEEAENRPMQPWNRSSWTTTSHSSHITTTAVAGVNSGNRVPGEAASTKSSLNSKGLTEVESTLLIVLIPTAIVLLIAVILILWFCCCHRKRLEERRKASIASGLSIPRQSAVFLVPTSNGIGREDVKIDGELFTAVPVYEGPAAVAASADASEFGVDEQKHVVSDKGRRSMDRRSVSIAAVDSTNGQRRASLVSYQQAAGSSALPINAFIVDAAPEALMATQPGSRRSSAVVDRPLVGIVNDQRRRQSAASVSSSDALRRTSLEANARSGSLSAVVDRPSVGIVNDQRRRQSIASASSSDALRRTSLEANAHSGSLSSVAASGPVVEHRKLSLTSYAELPSSDRRTSGSSTYYSGGAEQQQQQQQQRRVSLVLPGSDERRLSDGGGGGGSRRATATSISGMPGIDELHEAVVASALTASTIAFAAARNPGSRRVSAEEEAPYRAGSRALSLDRGTAPATPAFAIEGQQQQQQQQFRSIYGRQSWSGAATDEAAALSSEANYFNWPTE